MGEGSGIKQKRDGIKGNRGCLIRVINHPNGLLIMIMKLVITGFLCNSSSSFSLALSPDFYADTCPDVASIVTQSIAASTQQSNVVPPTLLRLFFHDAMVQGCDASILIMGAGAERESESNLSLRQEGFDAVDQAKQAVENVCPGVVSCADILALAARDAVVLSGGPSWEVQLGRLDGLTSTSVGVESLLPGANFDVPQLVSSFESVGLTAKDLVLLSGAHTIGFAHCKQFTNRLYNFQGVPGQRDPSLDPTFAASLEAKCPQTNTDAIVGLDETSPLVFNKDYYQNLMVGHGLLLSDQTLAIHPFTADAISELASSPPDLFFQNFVASMINLGNVITPNATGNIRQVCSAFN